MPLFVQIWLAVDFLILLGCGVGLCIAMRMMRQSKQDILLLDTRIWDWNDPSWRGAHVRAWTAEDEKAVR